MPSLFVPNSIRATNCFSHRRQLCEGFNELPRWYKKIALFTCKETAHKQNLRAISQKPSLRYSPFTWHYLPCAFKLEVSRVTYEIETQCTHIYFTSTSQHLRSTLISTHPGYRAKWSQTKRFWTKRPRTIWSQAQTQTKWSPVIC